MSTGPGAEVSMGAEKFFEGGQTAFCMAMWVGFLVLVVGWALFGVELQHCKREVATY